MTHPFTSPLILLLAISYLLMIYSVFAIIQHFVSSREEILK